MSSSVESPAWWESWDFLAPDTRQDFGRLVDLLERGLSSSGAATLPDEPAGWSGLARRGPWDRLVPSEWALLEVAPEEFARRADEGELGFWQMARDGRAASRSVWLWLDAGPDQLGACRVVQIALMLWLQRVCRRTGGSFHWGVVQAPEAGYEGFGAEELTKFLSLRSTDPPRRPPERMDGMVTWCVGSEGWMSQVPSSFQRVTLSQNGPESVELQAMERRLELPLPTGERAVRLLRDPMVWKVVKRTNAPVQRANLPPLGEALEDYTFSLCGKKLLLAYRDRIVVAPIPSSVREEPGKTRSYPLRFSGPVLGMSMEGRAIRVVQQVGGEWVFYRLNPELSDLDEMVRVGADDSNAFDIGTCWTVDGGWRLWIEDKFWTVKSGQLRPCLGVHGGSPLGAGSYLMLASGMLLDAREKPVYGLDPKPEGDVVMARSKLHQLRQQER